MVAKRHSSQWDCLCFKIHENSSFWRVGLEMGAFVCPMDVLLIDCARGRSRLLSGDNQGSVSIAWLPTAVGLGKQ